MLLAARVMVLALGLLTQSILAYTLLPEGRGAYAICALFGILTAIVITIGSDRGAQYLVMSRAMSVSQGVLTAFAVGLAGSGLAAVAAVPLILSRVGFFANADTRSFLLALSLIPLASFSLTVQMQLAGLRRFMRLGAFSFLQSAAIVLGLMAMVQGLGLGVDGAVLSLSLGHLVMITAGLWDLRRHCGLVIELPARDGFRRVIGYGIREYFTKIGYVLDTGMGGLLLGVLATRAEIGLFTAAAAIATRFYGIADAISTYLLPRVAGDEEGRPELTAFCARTTLWATAGALSIWAAVSTYAVPVLLSEAFTPVARLTWIMAIGIAACAGTDAFMAYFRGTDRPQVCSWAVWIGIAANVLLFFLLHPRLGIEGAAWAMTGGLLIKSLFLRAVFQATAHTPIVSSVIPRSTDIVYLWASARRLVARRSEG